MQPVIHDSHLSLLTEMRLKSSVANSVMDGTKKMLQAQKFADT